MSPLQFPGLSPQDVAGHVVAAPFFTSSTPAAPQWGAHKQTPKSQHLAHNPTLGHLEGPGAPSSVQALGKELSGS